MLECCICLVAPIMNQNDGSSNGTKQRKSTAVVDVLIHYKEVLIWLQMEIQIFWNVMLCQLVNIYGLLRP